MAGNIGGPIIGYLPSHGRSIIESKAAPLLSDAVRWLHLSIVRSDHLGD